MGGINEFCSERVESEMLQDKWIAMFSRQLRNWLRGDLGAGYRFWNHGYS